MTNPGTSEAKFQELLTSVEEVMDGPDEPVVAALKVQLALIAGSAIRARRTNDWDYLMMVIGKCPFIKEMPTFAVEVNHTTTEKTDG